MQEALKGCSTKNADEIWCYTSKAFHKCAIDTFGRKIKRNPDWLDAGIETLNPVINAISKTSQRKHILTTERLENCSPLCK